MVPVRQLITDIEKAELLRDSSSYFWFKASKQVATSVNRTVKSFEPKMKDIVSEAINAFYDKSVFYRNVVFLSYLSHIIAENVIIPCSMV
jgi:hypothetical protein